jgi:hypothetical protein
MQKSGKKLPKEDALNADLRDLTLKTRKLADELREFINGIPEARHKDRDKPRSLARDLPSLNRRRKVR